MTKADLSTVVFLGPSLRRDEARAILPDAHYLPPAKHGDVLAAAQLYEPDVIALIDGTFLQTLSVWHKEILYAMERGVTVFGASSMGALRAAECAAFGMIGVGAVYRMYADGVLEDDDEVALVHHDESEGFRPDTHAMVNLRATFQAALAEGVVSYDEHSMLVDAAKSLYFPERTIPAISKAARRGGLSDAAAERVGAFLRDAYVDVKKQDAIALLETIRDLERRAPSPPAQPSLQHSHVFQAFLERDRRVERGGHSVPQEAVFRYVALHDPDFVAVRDAALDRAVLVELAGRLDVQVTPDDVEREIKRFREERGLDDESLEVWIRQNDLDAEAFQGLMHELAVCRRMRAWLINFNYRRRIVATVVNELRISGRYDRAVAETIAHEQRVEQIDSSFDNELPPLRDLLRRHMDQTGWRPGTDLETWAEESGFDVGAVVDELIRAHNLPNDPDGLDELSDVFG